MTSMKMKNVEYVLKQLKSKSLKKSAKMDLPNAPKCGLCKFILNNPYQTICGCLYCKECIEAWLLCNTNCPGESRDCFNNVLQMNNGIREDKARAKEVLHVKVKCLYDGCDVIIEINKMSDHLDVCEYKSVQCSQCKEDLVQKDLHCHLQTQCNERMVICRFCGDTMTFNVRKNEHNNANHVKVCKDFIAYCPYKCENPEKIRIVDHLKGCPNRPTLCPLTLLGCTVEKLTFDQLENHFRTELLLHNELLVQYTKARNNKVKNLHLTLGQLDKSIADLKRNIGIIETDIKISNQRIIDYQPCLEVSGCGGDDEILWRTGEFVWKIEKFTTLFNNAKSGCNPFILSEPFYSNEFGYRMCLKMYPYGDGPGRGSHVSVFFVIMRGKYDDVLSWPFVHKVKLSLLSTSKSDSGHSEIFRPDSRSACYVKPVNSFNIGSGSPRFMSHDVLFKNYVVNNGFFIMAEVLN